MNKLVIFGDSYASSMHTGYPDTNNYSTWFEILAERLDCNLINYGEAGSSIEYSNLKLYEYINSSEYNSNDIIVFICTSTARIPLVHKSIPTIMAANWLHFIFGDKRLHPAITKYFRKHGSFFKTLFRFFNFDLAHQQRTNISFLLKSLPNQTLIMSAFEDVDLALDSTRKNLLSNTENFTLINANLYDISNAEFKDNFEFLDFATFYGGEIRHCHFTKTNNQILADQLYNCLIHKTDRYFNKDNFKTNILGLSFDEDNIAVLKDETLFSSSDNEPKK